jgi:hypothetical protein
LALAVCWTRLERGKCLRDLAGSGNGNVNVVGLKDVTQVGLVRFALAQALDSRLLVAEGLKKSVRKLLAVERLFSERGLTPAISRYD